MKRLLKLFVSLECKYDKLQFGLRMSSIEVSKILLPTLCHICNKTLFIQERLLSLEWRDSKCFPESIGVYTASPSRRASTNSSKAWKWYFLTEMQTSQPLLIFFLLCLCDCLTRRKVLLLFYNNRATYWACTGKKIKCFARWAHLNILRLMSVFITTKLMDFNRLTNGASTLVFFGFFSSSNS